MSIGSHRREYEYFLMILIFAIGSLMLYQSRSTPDKIEERRIVKPWAHQH